MEVIDTQKRIQYTLSEQEVQDAIREYLLRMNPWMLHKFDINILPGTKVSSNGAVFVAVPKE